MDELFRKIAQKIAKASGSFWTFFTAVLVVIAWFTTGPIFNYSNTWQLMINTTTTVVTFLMVFIIQNTQNRDGKAIHIKLDELLRAMKGTRPKLLDIDELPDKELEDLHNEFITLSQKYERAIKKRKGGKKKEPEAKIVV